MNWSSPLSRCPPSGGPGLLSRPLRGHLSSRTASSGPCQAANIPGRTSHTAILAPRQQALGRGGSAGTVTSTAINSGPAWQGEEGEGQDPTAAPHLALGTGGARAVSWVPCCPPALPPAGWASPGLSCSGPSCPPPAPVCFEAAAFEPAHLFPEPPESRPCTWRCRSRSRAGHSCC